MKKHFRRAFTVAAMALLALPAAVTAEVRRIELDVAGYLCGL